MSEYELGYDHDMNVKIRRGHEFEDAYNQLKDRDMRKRFQVRFVDSNGMLEEGVDAGGLTK